MSYYETAVSLAKEVGEKLQATRGTVIDILQKGDEPRDEITAVDLAINSFLIEALKKAYPDHRVRSEEGSGDRSDVVGEYEWVLDPIDGTANFARSIPHFATCIGLLHKGVPIVGAVYNPVTDELFSFDAEKGAFYNGREIHTSKVSDLSKSQGFFHIGRDRALWDWGLATQRSFLEGLKKVKDPGASALDLCFLAAGRAEIICYGMLTTQDVAAAIGIVRKAGGDVYTLTGVPVEIREGSQMVIATANKALLSEVLPLLHTDLLAA